MVPVEERKTTTDLERRGSKGRDERGDEDTGVESVEVGEGGRFVGLKPKESAKKGRWKCWSGGRWIQEERRDKERRGRQKY